MKIICGNSGPFVTTSCTKPSSWDPGQAVQAWSRWVWGSPSTEVVEASGGYLEDGDTCMLWLVSELMSERINWGALVQCDCERTEITVHLSITAQGDESDLVQWKRGRFSFNVPFLWQITRLCLLALKVAGRGVWQVFEDILIRHL